MFNVLNMISGFSEIGIIIFGMKQFGIVGGLAGVLFYQLGNMIPVPLRLSRRGTLGSIVCALLLAVLGFWYPGSGLAAMLFMSAGLQQVRSWHKTGGTKTSKSGVDFSKENKRFFRVLGFMLGFGFNSFTEIFCILVILIAAVRSNYTDKGFYFRLPKFNIFNWILVVHEIHYFLYCYALLLITYQAGQTGGVSGAVLASLCFGISWIPYVFSPRIYNKMGESDNTVDYRHKFIFGHSLLFILLLAIFMVTDSSLKIILWWFTGIGGTTELYITKVEKSFDRYDGFNHDSAENLGHIIGVICCIAVFLLYNELNVSVGIAGIFVFTAIILMISATIGGQKFES